MNRKSKKYVLLIMVLLLLLPGLMAGYPFLATAPETPKMDSQDFRNNMRKLWENHSTWEHLFIISDLASLQYRDPAMNRLLQSQNDIGKAIEPFYGKEAGEQFAELLTEHVEICAALLQAAKTANAPAFEEAVARWYANADQIAEFLNNLDQGNWPLKETKPILREYLDLTLEGAMARWKGDFAENMAAHDKAETQALEIADMLSDGIINQFRKKFK